MRKNIIADANLDVEFKGHVKEHSGKQRLSGHVVTVLQFAPRRTLQLAPPPSRSQNTPLQKYALQIIFNCLCKIYNNTHTSIKKHELWIPLT